MRCETPPPWVSRLPSPTPDISKSNSPLLSTSLLASVFPRPDPTILVSSCQPNFPSPAFSNLTLDNILHTGPSLFAHDSVWPRTFLLFVTATAAPNSSPRLTDATYQGATLEEHVSSMYGLCEEKDALHPHAVNNETHVSTMNTLDSQAPSPPSVTNSDQVVASCSLQEPIAGCTGGDYSPHVSLCSYDIV